MSKIVKTNITGIGDPAILCEKNTFYMYATNNGCKDFRCFTSKDGVNFIDSGVVLANEDSFGTDRFWAPEIYKYKNNYYLFYSAGANDGLMHVQVAISNSPLGPFKDIKKEPLINFKDKSTIDAHLFIDDDERKYLFYSLDCSTNVINNIHTSQIYACEINDTFDEVISDHIFISTPSREREFYSGDSWRWNEGPNVLKHNGKYYLTYSTNLYASREYCVGCYISDNILGPYKLMKDEPILNYIENEISGPGHNFFFKDFNGKLKVAFHIHTDYEKPSGNRRACYCDAYFDENDLLIIDYK